MPNIIKHKIPFEYNSKVTPNPIISRFKMGKVFYMVSFFGYNFTIQKVMVANFPNTNQPLVRLVLTSLDDEYTSITYTVEQMEIPKNGQKKDIILLTHAIAFCIDKQAVLNFIKTKIKKDNFNFKTYLNPNRRGTFELELVKQYNKAITLLKTI